MVLLTVFFLLICPSGQEHVGSLCLSLSVGHGFDSEGAGAGVLDVELLVVLLKCEAKTRSECRRRPPLLIEAFDGDADGVGIASPSQE